MSWLVLLVACTEPDVSEPIVPLADPAGVALLPPTWTVVGPPGAELGRRIAAAPASAGPGALLLSTSSDGLPATVILSGATPPGTYALADVWDGQSSVDLSLTDRGAPAAGDVDQDGHLDLWFGTELFFGPLVGRALRTGDADASVASTDAVAVAAGFDADADGAEDVLFVGSCPTGTIVYGPFSGPHPDPEVDPAQTTVLASDSCSGSTEATVLDDHFGTDHPAIAVGTTLFALRQPRGARPPPLADARHMGSAPMGLDDVGDLDGDGQHDLVFGDGTGSLLVAGPAEGPLLERPLAIGAVTGGWIQSGVGDLDGDGVEELLAQWNPDRSAAPDEDLWVVLFSPHPDPLDLSAGVPIAPVSPGQDTFGRVHADLDGDGLDDLVWTYVHREGHWSVDRPDAQIDAGEVSVWSGRDLLDARPTPP